MNKFSMDSKITGALMVGMSMIGSSSGIEALSAHRATSNETYTQSYELTEHCGSEKIVGNVALRAESQIKPVGSLGSTRFDKIWQLYMDVCGTDGKINTPVEITKEKSSGKIVNIFLKTAGIELTVPSVDTTTAANCAPTRFSDSTETLKQKLPHNILSFYLDSALFPCDEGFVAGDGSVKEPADDEVRALLSPAYRSAKIALTDSTGMDKALAKVNSRRSKRLRAFVLEKFAKGKEGKNIPVTLRKATLGIESTKKTYRATLAAEGNSLETTNNDSGTLTNVVVGTVRATAEVKSLHYLPSNRLKLTIVPKND